MKQSFAGSKRLPLSWSGEGPHLGRIATVADFLEAASEEPMQEDLSDEEAALNEAMRDIDCWDEEDDHAEDNTSEDDFDEDNSDEDDFDEDDSDEDDSEEDGAAENAAVEDAAAGHISAESPSPRYASIDSSEEE